MTRLKIFPGSCGFITKLAIWKIDKWTVGVEIKSECERLKAFNDDIVKVMLHDIYHRPFNHCKIYEMAGKADLHSGCPVPSGIIKAAEVELGLSLMKNVKIEFIKNENGVFEVTD
jgi:hypothetical protein